MMAFLISRFLYAGCVSKVACIGRTLSRLIIAPWLILCQSHALRQTWSTVEQFVRGRTVTLRPGPGCREIRVLFEQLHLA
jgi:hypothetical protein